MEIRNRNLILSTIVLGMITTVIIFVSVYIERPKSKPLSVSFLDIGQGDSIFIEAPNGAQMIIDGGPSNGEILTEIQNIMPFFDYSVDVILATHADADHIGGLPSILSRYDTSYVIQNGQKGSTQLFQQLQSDVEKSIEKNNTKSFIIKRGDVIVLDKQNGVFLFALHPPGVHFAKDTNDNSVVLQLVYGESSVILTGDAPAGVEKMLVYKDGTYLKSDILKAGHHGSKTSSSQPFIDAVSAPISIISAGENNRYGHPHQEVVQRLSKISEILKTYEDGTMQFQSFGREFIKKKNKILNPKYEDEDEF